MFPKVVLIIKSFQTQTLESLAVEGERSRSSAVLMHAQEEIVLSRDWVLVTALSVCRVTLPDAKQVQLMHWHVKSGGLAGGKSIAQSFKKKKRKKMA